MADQQKCIRYCGIGLFLGILIMSIALLATSFRRLESDEVGVSYDTYQKKLASTTQRAGLHSGPPGFKFIKFPSVFKSLSFKDEKCLNKEGVEIELVIEFQYRARPQKLHNVVAEFKDHDNYIKMLKFLARASIYDACSQFNTSEFQTRRSSFQELMYTIMVDRFASVSADITDLQVSNIKRPEEYEKVVRNKESAKENINIARNERPRALIEAKTAREEAITQGRINVQKAKSGSRVILSKAKAEATTIITALIAEAQAYASILHSQNLTLDGLMSYLGVRVLADNTNTVSIGFPAPAKTFN
ncbi:PREDICTED: uncharacterized protein LOC107337227 [Acropora digitifera]|uniref:uncharacterized protein LOC107337227 n=1 Tax=Acropora digitifera TaxID=70779 RepID=UPI00077AA737|nr:PREDICTED: uncharacterized protein LOC107337227 [Acropora digitifera]